MLQKTYSAYSDNITNQRLFIELGKNHLACWCANEAENKFTAFEFFQCNDYDASIFDSLINEVKLHSKLLLLDVVSTNIYWNINENIALPSAFAEENFIHKNVYLLKGRSSKDKIYLNAFNNISVATSVDCYLNTVAQKIFSHANFNGGYKLNASENETAAYLLFYPHYFSFIIYKNGALQLLHTKQYTSADDVLYFILNVFQQYNVEKNIEVITGGFINEDSQLFQTLYQYIENLKLGILDESLFASDSFKEYPPHYFLPFINYLA